MPLNVGTPDPKVWTWPVTSNTANSPRVTVRGTTVDIHTTGLENPVLSAGPGVVRLATAHPHWRVVVDHGERSTCYVGLASVTVSRGDQVGAAQPLGTVDGPLGFAIRRYGTPGSAVDPRPYLAAWPLLRGDQRQPQRELVGGEDPRRDPRRDEHHQRRRGRRGLEASTREQAAR